MEKLIHDLNERAETASNVVKFLKRSFSEIEVRQKNLDLARESVVERMMEIETLRESYEKGLKDLELDFCFKEGKKRKLAMEEDDLNVKREELLNDVRMREEKMKEQLVGLCEKINFMEMGQRSMHQLVGEKLKEIQAQEERFDSAWDSLTQRERKINIIERKMQSQASLMEEKEIELNSRVERRVREISLKEKELNLRWKVFIKEVKVADERFFEKQKLMRRMEVAENKLERLLALVKKSFKTIEARESTILAESGKQSELMEKEFEEFEQLKEKFLVYHDVKMEELASKEEGFNAKIKLLVEDAELRDEQLTKREKLGNQLLERLKLAKDDVEHLKETVHVKFKQVGLKETELEKREDSLISKEIQLEEKLKKLQSWEKELEVKQGEVDSVQELNQRRSEELERKEKSLNSVRELTRNCFKEHITIKKQLLLEKDLIRRRQKDLDLSNSVDIKFILNMDGKNLQMFLNDPEKDLKSMGDEIIQVLHLSLDPAKLILDAMVGFYPPHLRKDDVEIDVRKTCIILLEQFSKMTKKIQPITRKEAIELASSWKSKMGASGDDPLEVLGFLHLLAAYNLASNFDKDEILGFLKIADQIGQRPLRLCDFGFEDGFTDPTVEVTSHPASEEAKT